MKSTYCGYCFYNNVALAADHALKNGHATKILIVDWDVHHGQATQQMFYDDNRFDGTRILITLHSIPIFVHITIINPEYCISPFIVSSTVHSGQIYVKAITTTLAKESVSVTTSTCL